MRNYLYTAFIFTVCIICKEQIKEQVLNAL